jgi:hypothetical protein
MPFLMDKRIMEELQSRFPAEFEDQLRAGCESKATATRAPTQLQLHLSFHSALTIKPRDSEKER